MKKSEQWTTIEDLWSIISHFLFKLNNDQVHDLLSASGILIDWVLSPSENFSHATRNRKYRNELQARYLRKTAEERHAFSMAILTEMRRMDLPFSAELNAKLPIERQYNNENNHDKLVIQFKNISSLEGYKMPNRIFIGHGRSFAWRDLKDFIVDRLKLDYEEFNREPTAGMATKERLTEMLETSGFAFLVMTGEDEHADTSRHARENVVHEIGLFQGRLGFRKAIILLEEDCIEFSNIVGISQIRFPNGNITAIFEELRRVLEREGLIANP